MRSSHCATLSGALSTIEGTGVVSGASNVVTEVELEFSAAVNTKDDKLTASFIPIKSISVE